MRPPRSARTTSSSGVTPRSRRSTASRSRSRRSAPARKKSHGQAPPLRPRSLLPPHGAERVSHLLPRGVAEERGAAPGPAGSPRGRDGPRPGVRHLARPAPRARGPSRGRDRVRLLGGLPQEARGVVSGKLFEDPPRRTGGAASDLSPSTPLADRMRPRSLDEVEGPAEVVGANGFLRRAIAEDRVPSLILWGPPGVGKTTLARLIASQTASIFLAYSAVATGVKEMREVLDEARSMRARHGKRTILFLDEIHRFNRSQQDVFLPYVETGDVVLVGATTENPSFELNGALLSRCKVVVLEPLAPEAIARIVERALRDIARGLGARDFRL